MAEIIINTAKVTLKPGGALVTVTSEVSDESVQWFLSEELQAALVKELEAHLGGQFSDELDPVLIFALDMVSAS